MFRENQKVLFLCVKPKYMKHILSGKKDIEIRKQMPSLIVGDGIVLYSTSSEKEIVGIAKVKAIHNYKSKTSFWRDFKHRVGICIEDYLFYTLKAKKVIGIELEKVKKFDTKVDLEWIRMRYKPNFRPPQGYMYLTGEQANGLIRECTYKQHKEFITIGGNNDNSTPNNEVLIVGVKLSAGLCDDCENCELITVGQSRDEPAHEYFFCEPNGFEVVPQPKEDQIKCCDEYRKKP